LKYKQKQKDKELERCFPDGKSKPTIHPDIEKFTGIIPADIDVDKEITGNIMAKYR
jgi:hypothetical protein